MLGTGELIVILCVVLILFGGKKLPELARSLGVGIREFKKACNGETDEEIKDKPSAKKTAESVIIEVENEHDDREVR